MLLKHQVKARDAEMDAGETLGEIGTGCADDGVVEDKYKIYPKVNVTHHQQGDSPGFAAEGYSHRR
jgi:hypothetical protein